jgi:sec-independent protein translocase protein TatA
MFAGLIDGPGEIAILVIVILVLFGGSQIPKLAKNLGKAQQEFKKGLDQGQKEANADDKADKTESIEEKLARLDAIDKAKEENNS